MISTNDSLLSRQGLLAGGDFLTIGFKLRSTSASNHFCSFWLSSLQVYIFSHQSNWMHDRHLYSACEAVGCACAFGAVASNDWLEFCMLHFKLKNIWFRFYLFNPKLASFTLISTAIGHTIHWAVPHSHPHNTNNTVHDSLKSKWLCSD